MARFVLQLDCRRGQVVFIAQRAQSARIEHEVLSAARKRPEPARYEHAQHVSVRKLGEVAELALVTSFQITMLLDPG